jgi:hypothetical protein
MFLYCQGKVGFPGLDLDLSTAELDAIRIESRPKSGALRHLGPILVPAQVGQAVLQS